MSLNMSVILNKDGSVLKFPVASEGLYAEIKKLPEVFSVSLYDGDEHVKTHVQRFAQR